MSARARLQPRLASDKAIARPIPPAAPVTIAVRPRSSYLLLMLCSPKFHLSVIEPPVPHHPQVLEVILIEPPRLLGSLLGQRVQYAFDIAGLEIKYRLLLDRMI